MSVLLWALLSPAHALDLEEATQREFAYLRAEKVALEERLLEIRAEAGQRTDEAEGDIGRMQARLMAVRGERARLEEQLLDAEREQATRFELDDLLDSTLYQANVTLTGVALPEGEDDAARAEALSVAMTSMSGLIREGGEVRKDAGAFFLADGTRMEGEVVRLGNISTFGVASEGAGTLVPVGDGRMQLRAGPEGSARDLAAGTRPDTLALFLHEGTSRRVEEAAEKTWSSWIEAGGVVGLVIIGLGFSGLLLAFLRFLGLMVAQAGGSLPGAVAGKLESHDFDGALELVARGQNATARVIRAMLGAATAQQEGLDDVASEAILAETPSIERFGRAILVIAAVAPLLGLLGTVTGMIGTFDIITEFGTGDPRMLSGGISEALVTTQLGLIVAIPMLLLGNLLDRMAGGVLGRLELAALTVLNRMAAPPEAPIQLDEVAK